MNNPYIHSALTSAVTLAVAKVQKASSESDHEQYSGPFKAEENDFVKINENDEKQGL